MGHVLLLCALICAGCDVGESSTPATAKVENAPTTNLGRGMNFGNALEAPNEGDWGITLSDAYFDAVQQTGFESLRVPIRWSGHADDAAPYTIDENFFGRIDWVVDSAESRNLKLIINVHHYDEMMQDPAGNRDRLVGIWKQIAERYQDRSSGLLFELLNEPNGKLDAATWNSVVTDLITTIRAMNPGRTLVIGGVSWNSPTALEGLRLPGDDPNIVATFHYYDPMHFTHQGANWVNGSDAWLGTTWNGSDAEKGAIAGAFTRVAAWATREHRAVLLGEFGAYEKADMASRARWTSFVARTAESHGMAWAYWEFASTFGAYDPTADAYRPDLLNALLPMTD
jgi:endoglucanase